MMTKKNVLWGTLCYVWLTNTALQQVSEFIVVVWLYSEIHL